jgi:prepilin-type N-terminal cleavage/methylation domain-containing protein
MHRIARRRRRARRRHRNRKHMSGMTLIEVMIVMVIMAMVAVAAGFAVMPVYRRSQIQQAKTDAAAIRQMAVAYQIQFDDCPDVQALIDKEIMSASTTSTDPWGTPFEIACDDTEPVVTSPGPDKQLNTEDDIT